MPAHDTTSAGRWSVTASGIVIGMLATERDDAERELTLAGSPRSSSRSCRTVSASDWLRASDGPLDALGERLDQGRLVVGAELATGREQAS